jgi:cytochrome o ubiquinol oxidase subunit 1
VLPVVTDLDAFTVAKESGKAYQRPDAYVDIELPKNSAVGPMFGAIGFIIAYGLVWHIWWLVILSTLSAIALLILSGFARNTTRVIPAQQVRQEQQYWLDAAAAATPILRIDECQSSNTGLAEQEYAGGAP